VLALLATFAYKRGNEVSLRYFSKVKLNMKDLKLSTQNISHPLFNLVRSGLVLIVLASLVVLAGCSSKGAGQGEGDQYGLSESDLDAQFYDRFGDGSIPMAEGEGIFRDVNFAFDSYSVDDIGRQNAEYNAQILQENPDIRILLEGHCDERGTAEYNMALGARRAEAVKELMLSFGISDSRLQTISYGSEVPLEPGSNEAAWSKNRRVHFSGFRQAAR